PLAPRTALIIELHTAPCARRRGLATLCLRAMLHDLARSGRVNQVLVPVPTTNSVGLHLMAKLGFKCEQIMHEWSSFGRFHRELQALPNGSADRKGDAGAKPASRDIFRMPPEFSARARPLPGVLMPVAAGGRKV